MNEYASTSNSGGLLKSVYRSGAGPKGPISQMNDSMPEMAALRKRRDLLGKTQNMTMDK